MKNFHLTGGETSRYFSNIFMGQIPKSLVIGFVADEAANGTVTRNPYNFHHYKMKQAFIKLNGEIIPADPWTPDFENGRYMREYMELHRNIGIDSNEDHGSLVTTEQFAGGSYFMAWDLTGHKCNLLHRHLPTTGNLDLSLIFNEQLPENVRVIVYATSDAQIELLKSNGAVVKYF